MWSGIHRSGLDWMAEICLFMLFLSFWRFHSVSFQVLVTVQKMGHREVQGCIHYLLGRVNDARSHLFTVDSIWGFQIIVVSLTTNISLVFKNSDT